MIIMYRLNVLQCYAGEKGKDRKFECSGRLKDEFKEEVDWSLVKIDSKSITCGKHEENNQVLFKCICEEEGKCFEKEDIAEDLYKDGKPGGLSSFPFQYDLHL